MGKKTDAIAALFAAITERKPAAVCYAPEEDYGAFWARHAADAETLAAQRQAELHFMPKFLIKLFSLDEKRKRRARRPPLRRKATQTGQSRATGRRILIL